MLCYIINTVVVDYGLMSYSSTAIVSLLGSKGHRLAGQDIKSQQVRLAVFPIENGGQAQTGTKRERML